MLEKGESSKRHRELKAWRGCERKGRRRQGVVVRVFGGRGDGEERKM